MKNLVIGVGLATVACFLWGFLYWGVIPLPYTAWHKTPDDDAAQAALRQHFPESGTYYVPAFRKDMKEVKRRFKAGPLAFVHIHVDGREMMDPSIMVFGFLQMLVAMVLFAMLIRHVRIPTFRRRAILALWVGVVAVAAVHAGDSVWWGISPAWKTVQALYTFGFFAISGLILAKFIRTQPAAA